MATFGSDAFTDTNGTALTSHTPTVAGGSWSTAGTAGSSIEIQSNAARASADDQVVELDASPIGTDYYAQSDFTFFANANNGVAVRQQSGDSRYAFFRSGGGEFAIYKAGTASPGYQGSNVSVSLSSGVVYRLYLEAVGTSSTALKARVQRLSDSNWLTSGGTWQAGQTECITHTDSTNPITTAGKAAIYLSTSNGSSTGMVADDFVSADISSGPTYDSFATNNSALKWSPYNWKVDGTSAETNNPGAYLKATFSGTAARIAVDTTGYSGFTSYPTLMWSIDGASWQSSALSGSPTTVTLATGLADTSHSLILYYSATQYDVDKWTTPVNKVKITSFQVSTGGSLSTPTTESGRAIIYGDSISEAAVYSGPSSVARSAWSHAVGNALDSEYGVVAFGGQGWRAAIGGAIPNFHNPSDTSAQTWDKYWAGSSRLSAGALSPAPDFIIVNHGTNDGQAAVADATVQAAVEDWLADVRVAAPSAKIIVVVPFGNANNKRSPITDAVTAVGDTNVYLVDLGTTGLPGETGSAAAYSVDGLHPDAEMSGRLGAAVAAEIRRLTTTQESGSGGTGRPDSWWSWRGII